MGGAYDANIKSTKEAGSAYIPGEWTILTSLTK
jgi:hypothetical protein